MKTGSNFNTNLVNITEVTSAAEENSSSEDQDKPEVPPLPEEDDVGGKVNKPIRGFNALNRRLGSDKLPAGIQALTQWLHSTMMIKMTDGRTLVGTFVCTDRDNNIILGSCTEHVQPDEDGREEEPRVLGLAMIPGRHVVSICVDQMTRPIRGLD